MIVNQIRDMFERTMSRHPTADLSRLKENLDAFLNGRKLASPHPLQRPVFWYQGLRSEPWHAREELAAVEVLEQNYPVIRKELEHLLAARERFQQFRGGDPAVMKEYIKGDWTVLYLKDEFARAHDQEYIRNNRKLAPATTAILDSLPRLGETAFFAALEPGTHLRPHFGAENLRLFAHLGIVVPEGCRIRVGGQEATWEEGSLPRVRRQLRTRGVELREVDADDPPRRVLAPRAERRRSGVLPGALPHHPRESGSALVMTRVRQLGASVVPAEAPPGRRRQVRSSTNVPRMSPRVSQFSTKYSSSSSGSRSAANEVAAATSSESAP